MTASVISEKFIADVVERLKSGKAVRRKLPGNGFLHIERKLPFLCVHRRPPGGRDEGTDSLLKGESSHLISCGSPAFRSGLIRLVTEIVTTIGNDCGAFLILEIWACDLQQPDGRQREAERAAFRVVASKTRPATTTLEVLVKALRRIKIMKKGAEVELVYDARRAPPGLSRLLSHAEARRLNCYVIGLEVQPVFRNRTTNEIFPLVQRALHRGLAQAIKRGVFEFILSQTTLRPANYQTLGRRALVKAAWEVDRMLAEVNNSFGFLFQVTPVNIGWAWQEFRKQRFERPPVLHYRPLPIDVAITKRSLYAIPIERIEDPTLNFLFREKQIELDRQLSMMQDRGKRSFLYGSLQLFGEVSDRLVRVAQDILGRLPPSVKENAGRLVPAAEFAERAKSEIDYYRSLYPGISSTVEMREDTVGLMVSQGNLLIGSDVRIPESRVMPLLQHEVGTHVVTYVNGKAQPFHQLYVGLAGYDEVQEGLAVLAEYLVDGLSRSRLRLLAGRVVGASCLIEGATFVETYRKMVDAYGFDEQTAFTLTVRIFRGGGLTKDAVYLRGLVTILDYLKKGGELNSLFVGKIAATHIAVVQELQWRGVLHQAPLRPRYMTLAGIEAKMRKLRDGISLFDLVAVAQL